MHAHNDDSLPPSAAVTNHVLGVISHTLKGVIQRQSARHSAREARHSAREEKARSEQDLAQQRARAEQEAQQAAMRVPWGSKSEGRVSKDSKVAPDPYSDSRADCRNTEDAEEANDRLDAMMRSPWDRVTQQRRSEREKKQEAKAAREAMVNRLVDIHNRLSRQDKEEELRMAEEADVARKDPQKPFGAFFRSRSVAAVAPGEPDAAECNYTLGGRRRSSGSMNMGMGPAAPVSFSAGPSASQVRFTKSSKAWETDDDHWTSQFQATATPTRSKSTTSIPAHPRMGGEDRPASRQSADPRTGGTSQARREPPALPQPPKVKTFADVLIAEVEKALSDVRKAPLYRRQKTFRDLQRKYHPDKNPDHPEEAKMAFQRLMQDRKDFMEKEHCF